MQLSVDDLALGCSLPRDQIQALVDGSEQVTVETASALAGYFGTTSELWLGIQQDHDASQALRTRPPR